MLSFPLKCGTPRWLPPRSGGWRATMLTSRPRPPAARWWSRRAARSSGSCASTPRATALSSLMPPASRRWSRWPRAASLRYAAARGCGTRALRRGQGVLLAVGPAPGAAACANRAASRPAPQVNITDAALDMDPARTGGGEVITVPQGAALAARGPGGGSLTEAGCGFGRYLRPDPVAPYCTDCTRTGCLDCRRARRGGRREPSTGGRAAAAAPPQRAPHLPTPTTNPAAGPACRASTARLTAWTSSTALPPAPGATTSKAAPASNATPTAWTASRARKSLAA